MSKDEPRKVEVPPDQAWLYYTLDKMDTVLRDIRSNTGWILAVLLLIVVLAGCGAVMSLL